MARKKLNDFTIWKRPDTGFYVYRLAGWPANKRISTGTKDAREATKIAARA